MTTPVVSHRDLPEAYCYVAFTDPFFKDRVILPCASWGESALVRREAKERGMKYITESKAKPRLRSGKDYRTSDYQFQHWKTAYFTVAWYIRGEVLTIRNNQDVYMPFALVRPKNVLQAVTNVAAIAHKNGLTSVEIAFKLGVE